VQRLVSVALALRASHPGAFAHIEQFERQARELRRQSSFAGASQTAFTVDKRDALGLFLVIWLASAMQAVACCDYVLDVDRLSSDRDYQNESSRWFRTLGCVVDFGDCATPTAGESQSGLDMFYGAVEEAAGAIRSGASPLVLAGLDAVAERLPLLSASTSQVLQLVLV
jgi:hypothetical protein